MSTYSQIIISALKDNQLLTVGKLSIDLEKVVNNYYLDCFNQLCHYNGFGQGLSHQGVRDFLKQILQDFEVKIKTNNFYNNTDDDKLLDYISFLLSWQTDKLYNPKWSAVYKLMMKHRKNVTGTMFDIIASISVIIITITFVIKICG